MDEGFSPSLVRLGKPHFKNPRLNKKNDHNSWLSFFATRLAVFSLFSITIFPLGLATAQVSESRTLTDGYAISVGELRVPNKAWTHLQLAYKQFRIGNLRQAVREVDRALQIDPRCAPALSMKAFIELAAKNANAAVGDAARAASLDPYNPEAFVALAMAYNSVGDYRSSQTAAERAVNLRPDSWQGRLELAKSLYGQNKFDVALNELNSLDKDFPDVHLVRGNVLMRLGRSHEGAGEFLIFVSEAPGDARSGKIRDIIANLAPAPSN